MAKKKSTRRSTSSKKTTPTKATTKRAAPRKQPPANGSASTKPTRRRSKKSPPPVQPPPTWDERLISYLLPYRVEIGGWILFLIAILHLFGTLGLIASQNGLLQGWFQLWRQFAGWGTFFIFSSLAAYALYLALRQLKLPFKLTTLQIIGAELMVLAALPLSYQWGDGTLALANAGERGGLIGWGLGQPLLDLIGPIMTATLYVCLFLYGLALVGKISWNDALTSLRRFSHATAVWANQVDAVAKEEDAYEMDTVPIREPRHPALMPASQPATQSLRPAAFADSLALEAEEEAPTAKKRRSRKLPPYRLLTKGGIITMSDAEIDAKKLVIEQTLRDFGLVGHVTEVRRGPAVTQFGVEPGYLTRPGPDGAPKQVKIRVNQIANLNKDMALALAVSRLRIQAPVPGRGIVGIEVPNSQTAVVRLHSIITSTEFQKLNRPLAVSIGLDVSGTPQVADLAKMPHLLVAGTTGSGKSVFINAMVSSLIFSNTPDKLKLIMIDPKKVELIRYNGLPHMLGQVETEHDRVIGVLQWIVAEMDQRYQHFAEVGAKDLLSYNRQIVRYKDVEKLPHICVFIDELADLMAVYPAEVEKALCRLAQMARATGIHLVVATQRPSTDVLTGLIKANFPARASFSVASGIDSRVILDTVGAESLLGKGDMLFLPPEASSPKRVQGCFVADEEIDQIVAHWEEIMPRSTEPGANRAPWEKLIARQSVIDETDELIDKALELVNKYDTISTSLLQRRLRIGFPRAARLMETLHEMGMVADPKHGGKTRKTYSEATDGEDPLDQFIQS